MQKYIVSKNCILEGKFASEGDSIELDDSKAETYLNAGFIKLTPLEPTEMAAAEAKVAEEAAQAKAEEDKKAQAQLEAEAMAEAEAKDAEEAAQAEAKTKVTKGK